MKLANAALGRIKTSCNNQTLNLHYNKYYYSYEKNL